MIYLEIKCSICLGILDLSKDTISVLKCGHVFHYDCLVNWIRINSTCPECRCEVGENSFVNKIYPKVSENDTNIYKGNSSETKKLFDLLEQNNECSQKAVCKRIVELENENEKVKSEFDELKIQIGELQKKLDNSQSNIESLNKENCDLKSAVETLQAEKSEITKSVEEKVNKAVEPYLQMKKEFESCKEKMSLINNLTSQFQSLKEKNELNHSAKSKDDFQAQKDPSVFVFHNHKGNQLEASKFDFETKKWVETGCVLFSREAFCTGAINKKVYIVGGYKEGDKFTSSVEVFDENFQITKASSMNIGRQLHGMCAFDDRYLIVAGGCNHIGNLKSCEIYDTYTDRWEETCGLSDVRASFPLVHFKNKILAIGGCNKNVKNHSIIESFDIKTKKWEAWSTKLLEGRCDHGAVAFDDKFYVFGGVGDTVLTSVEMYSIETGQFTYVKPMPTPLRYITYCKVENSICLFGLDSVYSKVVLVYDTETDEWTNGVKLPFDAEAFSACCF